jgi:hypothetical protein
MKSHLVLYRNQHGNTVQEEYINGKMKKKKVINQAALVEINKSELDQIVWTLNSFRDYSGQRLNEDWNRGFIKAIEIVDSFRIKTIKLKNKSYERYGRWNR